MAIGVTKVCKTKYPVAKFVQRGVTWAAKLGRTKNHPESA